MKFANDAAEERTPGTVSTKQISTIKPIDADYMKTQPRILVRLATAFAAAALHVSVPQQARAGDFTGTASLGAGRAGHSATLLVNGQVLVEGGYNGALRLTSSELYDPSTAVWAATGALATGRTTHTATLLSNGKVLVAGGHIAASGSTATCELYDPAVGRWTQTGAMATSRGAHTAILLLNGKVLVVGGYNRNTGSAVSTAELYDPVAGTWTATGSLISARDNHTATLLLDGKVLVTGGAADNLAYASLSSAEVYDPQTGNWKATATMNYARQYQTATLLPNGRVLVAGGGNLSYFDSSAEIYDPAAGAWTVTGSLAFARGIHTATLLPDGRVLVTGGNHNTQAASTIVPLASSEIYDPAGGIWLPTGALNNNRSTHTATLLPSGQVLITAGYYVSGPSWLSSAEIDDSAEAPPTLINPMKFPAGAFQLTFMAAPNAVHTILTTTDASLAIAKWTVLGAAPEFSPGLFVFTDPQGGSGAHRFYTVRSP